MDLASNCGDVVESVPTQPGYIDDILVFGPLYLGLEEREDANNWLAIDCNSVVKAWGRARICGARFNCVFWRPLLLSGGQNVVLNLLAVDIDKYCRNSVSVTRGSVPEARRPSSENQRITYESPFPRQP